MKITYYLKLKQAVNTDGSLQVTTVNGQPVPVWQTDAVGTLVQSLYRGPQSAATDVLLATRYSILPAYESLIGKPLNDYAYVGQQLLPAFSKLKADKVQFANARYAARLTAGVTVNGILLGSTDSDQTMFHRLSSHLDNQERLLTGDALAGFSATNLTLTDSKGLPHTLTVAAYRQMIVAYGAALLAMWTQAATLNAAIAAATTVAQLTGIKL